ncbi:MAG: FAD-dependent oxidoreductase [Elusimicrobia bacterium]|nr:FAD-dependent oxidoreductase [Elusimicrobiota bacterium]
MSTIRTMLGKGLCGVLLACSLSARAADADRPRVIVVGGGLAGLVTAYELQERGIPSLVLEAGTAWGGRVATVEYGKGLRAEYGLHEIWDKNPLMDYVKKFSIPLSEPEQPYSSVYMDGKLFPYVQDTAAAFHASLFTPEERAGYDRWLKECEALYDETRAGALTPRLAELQKISFAKWVESFRLSPRVTEFIRLGLECEVAADWDGISAVYGIMQEDIFLHGTQQCRHARDGNGTIIDAFVKAIRGPKVLGALVTRVVRARGADGKTRVVVHYKENGVMRSAEAEKVVLAVPYHMLHAIQMEPSLTDEQWRAVDGLSAGTYTVVHFILDVAANKKLLVDGKIPFPVLTRGPLGVIYGFLEKPEPGQTEEAFTLLVHGDYSRSYLEPRDKIRGRLLAELDKIWPGFSSFARETHFYGHHPAATPGWPVGRSPLDELHASLRAENVGLYLAGDYLYSSHSDGAVRSGREAAVKVAAVLAKAPR